MRTNPTSVRLTPMQIGKLILRLGLTVLLFMWILRKIDMESVQAALRQARWVYLLGVWGFTAIFFWINSLKLKWVLSKLCCTVRTSTVFAASAVGCMYSLILPGIVSTGMKWYLLRQDTGDGSRVLGAMVYNQLSALFVAFGISLVALAGFDPGVILGVQFERPMLVRLIAFALLMGLVGVITLTLSPRLGGRLLARAARGLACILPQVWWVKVEGLFNHIRDFQRVPFRFHLWMALITVLNMLIGGVAVYVCASRGANLQVTLGLLLCLPMTVYVLGRIPITIGNLGIRESVLVGLLSLHGVDASAALLMSMIVFTALLFMALLGVICQLSWSFWCDPER